MAAPETSAAPVAAPPAPLAEGLDEARRYHQAGNVERAAAIYRRLVQAEPNNGQVWYLLNFAMWWNSYVRA